MKSKKASLVLLLCGILLFTGCQQDTDTPTSSQSLLTANTASTQEIEISYTQRDITGSYDETVRELNLADSGITITEAGTYILSGTVTDGQLVVNAPKDAKVQLVLKGVSVTNKNGPAIYIKQADKVFLTLYENTVNTLSDSDSRPALEQEETNACIFSKEDLTINGTGSLTVTGNYNHGIYCKDDLSITSGTITVSAKNDGVKGKDSVCILDGTILITAGGDGIQSNNATDTALGYISIDGSDLTIHANSDGIQAETLLQINGGKLSVTSGNSSNSAEESQKGIKAGSGLTITGGEMTIDSIDDALHTNGDLSIKGGNLLLSSGDDGIHADSNLFIENGTIHINKSYEGIEAEKITISGGNLSIRSDDDGLNAASGESTPFQKGSGQVSDCDIHITGGSLLLVSSGDGIDSNASLTIDGGEVIVYGPTNQGNSALDYDQLGIINGGTLFASSSAGMVQGMGSSSTQPSFTYQFQSRIPAQTACTVTDEAGTVILSYTPEKSYQAVVISSSELELGKTYQITAGSETGEVTLSSITTGSQMIGRNGGMAGSGGGRSQGREKMNMPPAEEP